MSICSATTLRDRWGTTYRLRRTGQESFDCGAPAFNRTRRAVPTSCRTDGSRNNAIPNANAERFIISISAFLLCLSRIQLIIIVQLVFVVSTEVGTGSIDENFDATLPCNNNAKANLRPESHCI